MTFEKTIDWDAFWREADDQTQAQASPGSEHVPDVLTAFFEKKGVPDSFADVGCGPGTVVFELVTRYPEMTVVGYDAADSILESNRKRAMLRAESWSERAVGGSPAVRNPFESVQFERTVLPEFEPDRTFEVIFAHCTLCYVAETNDALRALYDAVADGGYLVLGYISEHARRHFQNRFEGLSSGGSLHRFDPVERFELVLEGESVLSYRRIHDVLGTWPQSIWSVVEKPDARWAWGNVPLVWVPKGRSNGNGH